MLDLVDQVQAVDAPQSVYLKTLFDKIKGFRR
jgi:hypothetical protein